MQKLKWSEREFLLTLYLYRTSKLSDLNKNSELIIDFTNKLNLVVGNNRTCASIGMRMSNWSSVNPKYKGRGLSGGAKKCAPYWDKYAHDIAYLKSIYDEFEDEYQTLELGIDVYKEEIEKIMKDDCLELDSKNSYIESLVSIRNPIFQQNFRKELLEEFSCECAICGVNDKRLLNASHIIPYSLCVNKKDMYKAHNGLLLCIQHDALFDKYLISFDNNGQIKISEEIDEKIYCFLNISSDLKIDYKYLREDRIENLLVHYESFLSRR